MKVKRIEILFRDLKTFNSSLFNGWTLLSLLKRRNIMKKLLMVAALLAVGVNLYAGNPSEGFSNNFIDVVEPIPFDTMYPVFSFEGNDLGIGFGDITTDDTAVHNEGAVNIFRNKGGGWDDIASTIIKLKVLEPIMIESEIDFMYTEAVEGDGLNIGDIGFRVKGDGNAVVTFTTLGELFQLPNARTTIKGHEVGFYTEEEILGENSLGKPVNLNGTPQELEVDIYLEDVGDAGYKGGIIIAEAMYQ